MIDESQRIEFGEPDADKGKNFNSLGGKVG
jgi:hypothetical protein